MAFSIARLVAILRKEVQQLRRDRLTIGMIAGIPIMQMLLFGFAINTDVRHLSGGVADMAQTELSRRLVADIEASQVIDVTVSVNSGEQLKQLLDRGEISIGIVIPPDFERRLQQQERPAAQLLVDGSDPIILGTARGLSAMTFETRPPPPRADRDGPLFEFRNYYNPERRSSVFVVPGLIGVILTMTMVLFTSVAIVRERERGNLELLINTPVRTAELMVGKIIPYVVIGLIQVSLILGIGVWLFYVPIRGSIADVYIVSLVFIAADLGLGLVISTLVKNQFQAMQMTFFFFLPSILLSGFMFPFEGMPEVAKWLAEVLPLTHFLRLIRGIMLRGAELIEMQSDLYALLVFMVVALTIAILRFNKRLD